MAKIARKNNCYSISMFLLVFFGRKGDSMNSFDIFPMILKEEITRDLFRQDIGHVYTPSQSNNCPSTNIYFDVSYMSPNRAQKRIPDQHEQW